MMNNPFSLFGTLIKKIKSAGLALVCLLLLSGAANGLQEQESTTAEDLRREVSEAMEAIASYSAQQRDEALSKAREAMDRLDVEIERREATLRENWAEMSERSRELASARLQDMRQARQQLAEQYGGLASGSASAWTELRQGFSNAWSAFSDAWRAADEEQSEASPE